MTNLKTLSFPARRSRTADLRMPTGVNQLQSSALPTELSRGQLLDKVKYNDSLLHLFVIWSLMNYFHKINKPAAVYITVIVTTMMIMA